jgi:hypothetical protein
VAAESRAVTPSAPSATGVPVVVAEVRSVVWGSTRARVGRPVDVPRTGRSR